jgi:hypothetical protein
MSTEFRFKFLPWQKQCLLKEIDQSEEKYFAIQKGRRLGATHGLMEYALIKCVQGFKILWGDTVATNINRYVERYGYPCLNRNKIPFNFNKSEKQLTIFDGHIDFRSADRPENWEGFGYDLIILNEAGIILKNPYLYNNAVLPMLLDNPKSKLIAAGVPKGRYLKDGTDHPFYTISKKAKLFKYSTFDNTLLDPKEIKALIDYYRAINPKLVDQEIYGEFIEYSDGELFVSYFDEDVHIGETELKHGEILISIDFNKQPLCYIVGQIQRKGTYIDINIIDEESINSGDIIKLCENLKEKDYIIKNKNNLVITGDATGKSSSVAYKGNKNHFDKIVEMMGLSRSQIKVRNNPSHKQSREDVNFAFYYSDYFNIQVNPKCTGLIRDFKIVNYNEVTESIIKTQRGNVSEQADLLDCYRYFVSNFLKDDIKYKRALIGYEKPQRNNE